ncbi:MAG: hypothetical protein ACYTGZ_06885 [Planctomycetota bacterium]
MRVLAEGKGDYKKYKKLLQEKFICLNVYCKSVADEHNPRGPEGPYQFKYKSVPVLLFKRWNGETLVDQFGFTPNVEQGTKRLANFIDRALKKNGPVSPPKALRPLLKGYAKAEQHLAKKLISPAVRELQKVVKGGANKKKFPETPDVAVKAQAKLDELLKDAAAALEKAGQLEPDVRKKELNRIGREYGGLGDIKKRVKAALKQIS